MRYRNVLRPSDTKIENSLGAAAVPPRSLLGLGEKNLKIAGMKQIIAIVRPFLAEKVLNALAGESVEAIVVREVKGFGRQKSYLDEYRGSEYSLAYLPKVQLTLWVEDDRAEAVIRAIITTARTGRMGDGKIFVLPVSATLSGERLEP